MGLGTLHKAFVTKHSLQILQSVLIYIFHSFPTFLESGL